MKRLLLLLIPLVLVVGCSDNSDLEARLARLEAENASLKEVTQTSTPATTSSTPVAVTQTSTPTVTPTATPTARPTATPTPTARATVASHSTPEPIVVWHTRTTGQNIASIAIQYGLTVEELFSLNPDYSADMGWSPIYWRVHKDVERTYSTLQSPITYNVSSVEGTGTYETRDGKRAIRAHSDCTHASPSAGWGLFLNSPVEVIGIGTGYCDGWSFIEHSVRGKAWLPNTHIQAFSASVATATPAPTQAPTPRPTATPVPTQAPAPTVSAGGGGGGSYGSSVSPYALDGTSYLVADDGTFLGDISSNSYASDSICNSYGSYGSKYESDSIRNEYGTYGSKYSNDSAYNKYTSTPPKIIQSRRVVGYLTKNDYLSGAIDPDELLIALDCLR